MAKPLGRSCKIINMYTFMTIFWVLKGGSFSHFPSTNFDRIPFLHFLFFCVLLNAVLTPTTLVQDIINASDSLPWFLSPPAPLSPSCFNSLNLVPRARALSSLPTGTQALGFWLSLSSSSGFVDLLANRSGFLVGSRKLSEIPKFKFSLQPQSKDKVLKPSRYWSNPASISR